MALLAACGGSDKGGAPQETPAEAGPTSGVFGQAPAAASGIPAVILLRPVDGTAPTPSFGEPVIDQFGLVFSPTELLVRAGTTVVFRNSEASLSHNVTVRRFGTNETLLSADALAGEELRVDLPDPGAYDVTCDVHPGMLAFIYATDAPIAVFAGNDGSFEIAGVPPGRWELRTWTAGGGLAPAQTVTVTDAATEIDLRPTG